MNAFVALRRAVLFPLLWLSLVGVLYAWGAVLTGGSLDGHAVADFEE